MIFFNQPECSKFSVFFRFPHESPVQNVLLSHASHMPFSIHPPSSDNLNGVWREFQKTKALINVVLSINASIVCTACPFHRLRMEESADIGEQPIRGGFSAWYLSARL
jgi:hypothetical protein